MQNCPPNSAFNSGKKEVDLQNLYSTTTVYAFKCNLCVKCSFTQNYVINTCKEMNRLIMFLDLLKFRFRTTQHTMYGRTANMSGVTWIMNDSSVLKCTTFIRFIAKLSTTSPSSLAFPPRFFLSLFSSPPFDDFPLFRSFSNMFRS